MKTLKLIIIVTFLFSLSSFKCEKSRGYHPLFIVNNADFDVYYNMSPRYIDSLTSGHCPPRTEYEYRKLKKYDLIPAHSRKNIAEAVDLVTSIIEDSERYFTFYDFNYVYSISCEEFVEQQARLETIKLTEAVLIEMNYEIVYPPLKE